MDSSQGRHIASISGLFTHMHTQTCTSTYENIHTWMYTLHTYECVYENSISFTNKRNY